LQLRRRTATLAGLKGEDHMSNVEIIGAPMSSYVRVVRIAFAEKGVPYDFRPAAPHSADVDAIHPMGKIPCMRHGDIELFESKAICTYLDKAFPGPKLIPDDALGAAQVEQWISFVNTVTDPAIIRQYVVPGYIIPGMAQKAPDRACIEAAMPNVEKQLGILEKAVTGRTWLVGDTLTLADINVIPILAGAVRFPESAAAMEKYPNLKAYYDLHAQRPSVRDTAPPMPKA
jgi:glutathione S-transferase